MPISNMNVDKLVGDDSFRAWAEGRAESDEKQEWDRWVQQSAKNRRLARRAQQKIAGFSFTSSATPRTSMAWMRLQRGIECQSRPQRFPATQKRRQSWIYYGIAASVIVIIVAGLSSLLMRPTPGKAPAPQARRTIQTAYGEKKKITLSNGASMVLNAHSTLTYISNRPESGNVRVTLQGEAYFATEEHDQSGNGAFTVQTPDGDISDIGTQFVVSTREGHTQVILKRGKVAIYQSAGDSGKKPVLMNPGQMAMFSKTSRHIQLKAVNPNVYTSWTTNKLIFDRTPLATIKNRLEHTFGVRVVTCGARLARRPLSGAIKNAGLSVIVSAVAEALHTSYRIKDDTVYIGQNCQ